MDGGMLSQDEINALLNSMDVSGGDSLGEDTGSEAAAQEQISGYGEDAGGASGMDNPENSLTDVEKDAIGEVANISMGSSATTLYSLVNRKVYITTPVVTLATWSDLIAQYERPCVFIQIKYTQGLDGTNILVLKEQDVKVITDLMMGGDGTNTEGELGELHLSAISEAMNQMMGAAATSLSTMLNEVIDISPPDSSLLDLMEYQSGDQIASFLGGIFVRISFRMQIDNLVDSSIMQIYPIDFSKKLVDKFISTQMGGIDETISSEPSGQSGGAAPEGNLSAGMNDNNAGMNGQPMNGQPMNGQPMNGQPMNGQTMNGQTMNGFGMDPMGMGGMGMNPMGMDMGQNMGMNPMGANPMGMNPMGMNPMGMNPMGMNGQAMNNGMGMNPMGMYPMGMNPMGMNQMNMQNVSVQPVQFQSFSENAGPVPGQENIGLIMDVPLEVTVELGRTSKNISEILNFAPGTIIELDRIAGEPIDVLVNGKFVAKGEVVVIEESFAVRVTEIIK